MAKSPRIVPGAEANGFVVPKRAECESVKLVFRIVSNERTATSLDGLTPLPYHSTDGTAQHI